MYNFIIIGSRWFYNATKYIDKSFEISPVPPPLSTNTSHKLHSYVIMYQKSIVHVTINRCTGKKDSERSPCSDRFNTIKFFNYKIQYICPCFQRISKYIWTSNADQNKRLHFNNHNYGYTKILYKGMIYFNNKMFELSIIILNTFKFIYLSIDAMTFLVDDEHIYYTHESPCKFNIVYIFFHSFLFKWVI